MPRQSFQDKTFELLSQFYPCVKTDGIKGYEKGIAVLPYNSDLISLIIAKLENKNVFVLFNQIKTTKPIQEKYAALSNEAKTETRDWLEKHI